MADVGEQFIPPLPSGLTGNDPLDDSLALDGWWPASVLAGGPEDPEDMPSGWRSVVERTSEQRHILDTIEDPVAEKAEKSFRVDRREAEFEEALEQLSGDKLSEVELAALAALDAALGQGADVEEALATAIAAAENYFGGSSGFTTQQGPGDDSPSIGRERSSRAARREDVADARRDADSPAETFTAPSPSRSPVQLADLDTTLNEAAFGVDPAFGFGFDFQVPAKPIQRAEKSFDHRDETTQASDTSSNLSDISSAKDLIVRESGDDTVSALGGDDYVYGDRPTNYDASLHTAASPLTDPEFSATGGDDTLNGDAGDDRIWGGAGNDTLSGGSGLDTLYGNSGQDNIFGYAGDDVLVGGSDADQLTGGEGADEFQFADAEGADVAARVEDLGVDILHDFNISDGDMFGLSDALFGFGDSGSLTDGDTYFEVGALNLDGTPVDIASGNSGPAIVAANQAGGSGVDLYYTDDPSQMTDSNSYQIADVVSVNIGDLEASAFNLRS